MDAKSGPGFQYAHELVAHIRKHHGDTFSIGVAGFPETHPESKKDRYSASIKERDADIQHLKDKINAGADFVLCQFTFDSALFLEFLGKLRATGVKCPVLPGVMPISEHASTRLLSHTWGVRLPPSLEQELQQNADDVDMIRAIGNDFTCDFCHTVLSDPAVTGLHLFVYDSEQEIKLLLAGLIERGWHV